MLDEIQQLWDRGIATTGCCCGHLHKSGYVGVTTEHIPAMKALGYKVQYNPMYPDDEDSFIPRQQ